MDKLNILFIIIQTICAVVTTVVTLISLSRKNKEESVNTRRIASQKKMGLFSLILLLNVILSALLAFVSFASWDNSLFIIVLISLLLCISWMNLVAYVNKFASGRKTVLIPKKFLYSIFIAFLILLLSLSYSPIILHSVNTTNRTPMLIKPSTAEGKINKLDKSSFFETIVSGKIKIWKSHPTYIENIDGDGNLSATKDTTYLIAQVIQSKHFLLYDGEKRRYTVWDEDGNVYQGISRKDGFYSNDGKLLYKWISKVNDQSDDNRMRFMHSFDGIYGIELIYEKDLFGFVREYLQDKCKRILYFNEIRRYLLVAESIDMAKQDNTKVLNR